MLSDVLLDAAGNLRQSYEDVDWAAGPLGPMSSWSPALRNATELALSTRFPVTLFWGPQLILVYNEAYVDLIADKHPAALGAPAGAVFPEVWDTVGPMMESVLTGGGATWVEDAYVPLWRRGRLEEAYFTFSHSPVRGADGSIEGGMAIAVETTAQVIDHRRLEMLSTLRELLGGVETRDEVRRRALPILRANRSDLPIVDIVAVDPYEASGDERGHPTVAGADGDGPEREVVRFEFGSGPSGPRQGLVVELSEQLARDAAYMEFLRLIVSSLGQATDRLDAREAERAVAAAGRDMSEALQRSLLTRPLQPEHLQVAVRYRPASEEAQIGGDWYDSFLSGDGTLTLVIGDVTGHDRRAVAAMAQARNLLRGISYASPATPGEVLTALDEAMHGLALGVYATAILGQIEQGEQEAERGLRTLRWSNAGHPPPVLLEADGGARLLHSSPEPLLGLGGSLRTDHSVTLKPGSSVVLYTDGLVERRGTPLQASLDLLTRDLAGLQDLSAEELCDHLLAELGDTVADDIALLVIRAFPEDAPRPAEAGPSVMPADLRDEAAKEMGAGGES